jgi:hypothetical protein
MERPMTIFFRPLTGAGLLLSTAIATASPIVLDTEQKAASALETTLFKADVPRTVNGHVDDVLFFADFMLRKVNAATTPAALLSAPTGITIACSISGSFKARMPDVQPRVLHLRFTDCKTPILGPVEGTFNGHAAITLPADTFRPETLSAVRFGTASSELTMHHISVSPGQTNDTTEAYNIAVRGDISMASFVGSGPATSTFRINGYYDQRSDVTATPPAQSGFYGYKVSSEQLSVVRTSTFIGDVSGEDTQLLSGSISFTQTQPFYGVFADAYTFNDYRVNRITDFGPAWNETLSVDGRITATINPFFGGGCLDGLYVVKTRVPLSYSLDTTQTIQSGELVVNGAVARFYSATNTPPGLPVPVNGMLLNLRVRDVGTFNYDAATWLSALSPVGQCF